MKNLKQIDKEIKQCEEIAKDNKVEPKDRKAALKKLILLRDIRKYLEFNPTKDFCESERVRLAKIIDSAYDSWNNHYQRNRENLDKLPMARITKIKNEFLKDIDLALMKNQVKNLTYILS